MLKNLGKGLCLLGVGVLALTGCQTTIDKYQAIQILDMIQYHRDNDYDEEGFAFPTEISLTQRVTDIVDYKTRVHTTTVKLSNNNVSQMVCVSEELVVGADYGQTPPKHASSYYYIYKGVYYEEVGDLNSSKVELSGEEDEIAAAGKFASVFKQYYIDVTNLLSSVDNPENCANWLKNLDNAEQGTLRQSYKTKKNGWLNVSVSSYLSTSKKHIVSLVKFAYEDYLMSYYLYENYQTGVTYEYEILYNAPMPKKTGFEIPTSESETTKSTDGSSDSSNDVSE